MISSVIKSSKIRSEGTT